jgi:hypothetical protein
MKRPFIFVGPSVPLAQVKRILPNAVFLGPAVQGELLSVARMFMPEVIGFIDGLWRAVPSVWHKEITSALSIGVPVLGAASMGALRAVECAPWGAVPVGKIAERYANGDVDDDEVVLLHGAAEEGYRALTVPMINLRFTVESMVKRALIKEDEGRLWIADFKNVFYGERTWQKIGQMMTDEKYRLLRKNYIDQKRLDAVEMCKVIADGVTLPRQRVESKRHDWGFGTVMRTNDMIVAGHAGKGVRLHEIAGAVGSDVATSAMDRALALRYALELGLDENVNAGKPSPEWCKENDMSMAEGKELWREEAILNRARELLLHVDAETAFVPTVNNFLRTRGNYKIVKTTIERN